MSCYKLWILDVNKDWDENDRLYNALRTCPRIFFLARLKDGRFAAGMYTEDEDTMDAEIECFLKEGASSNLDTYDISELVFPDWEFKVPEERSTETYCIKCPDCLAYDYCLGCPKTPWYKE